MPARRPHHRSIWESTDRQSRSFHMARLYSALRLLVRLRRAMLHRGRGLYAVDEALALQTSVVCDEMDPYLEAPTEEASE